MKFERLNAKELTTEEVQHLEKLKSTVEAALADGIITEGEMAQIKSIILADGQVTYEELRTLHETVHSWVGDDVLPLDWHLN